MKGCIAISATVSRKGVDDDLPGRHTCENCGRLEERGEALLTVGAVRYVSPRRIFNALKKDYPLRIGGPSRSGPMTKKLFWIDPYLTQLVTQVTGVNGNDITVDQTIFFAFSGGQESDYGTIGNHRVLEARKEGKEIVYTVEDGHALKPGDLVSMNIDWERRYRLMRLHFAAEIVLELAYQNLESIKKIGAHIAQDKARIDFEWGDNLTKVLPDIQTRALEIIEADQEILSAFSDEEKEERYWEIRGFARVPCGGTHLRKTGEIGEIELKRKNPGKGKERIEIHVSKNAV